MNQFFPEISKNFGFGCMRFPLIGEEIDYDQVSEMVDAYLEAGFNYFDTAHGYMSQRSETTLKKCLTSRYPRDRYILTDKLSNGFFERESDIRPMFESQLKACGVDYFDFYLMHCQNTEFYKKFEKCNAYRICMELKAEGKIRHFGISFHDTAEVLEKILTEHPEIEVVQIQFNYLDYNDPAVESGKCYDVCLRHHVPVIVMEPVKGGSLAKLPDNAQKILDEIGGGTPASYALRYAASFKNVMMVLSGMSTIGQMKENIETMQNFKPLTVDEVKALDRVVAAFKALNLIPCTACHYCTDGCPMGIRIPELFQCMNTRTAFGIGNTDYYYNRIYTSEGSKASDCISCGQCEGVCPQHLDIRDLLHDVARVFEGD